MSGHTPGPWKAQKGAGWMVARPDAIYRRECALAVGMTPATTLVSDPAPYWSNDSESKANAILMAAAPDLLAALKLYIRCRDEGRLGEENDAIEAAIAKAEAIHE